VPDTSKHLLLVEDEASLRAAIAEQLGDRGYEVEQAESGEAAVARLTDFAYDILITDLRLPGIDGSAVVEAAVGRYPDIIAIVVTGYGTVKDAVEAINGARGISSASRFRSTNCCMLDSALEQRRLRSKTPTCARSSRALRFEGIVGKSRAMTHLFQLLETVAATNSTLLIVGETGSGKEVVARAIHHNGPRRMHRFVALNCSAIPETLLEAELFGHVRGAFTGAVANRQGRLEQAHKGTLFLDEVGTMSPGLQMKLLRVLQEREFERVGDSHTTKVDVRVIAATNNDLGRMVADGQFREDLFYRLNVIPVQLPPLRERKEDIPLLVQHFREVRRRRGRAAPAAHRLAGSDATSDNTPARERQAQRHRAGVCIERRPDRSAERSPPKFSRRGAALSSASRCRRMASTSIASSAASNAS
jgi:two-component system response regulator PilR (NtrC family)